MVQKSGFVTDFEFDYPSSYRIHPEYLSLLWTSWFCFVSTWTREVCSLLMIAYFKQLWLRINQFWKFCVLRTSWGTMQECLHYFLTMVQIGLADLYLSKRTLWGPVFDNDTNFRHGFHDFVWLKIWTRVVLSKRLISWIKWKPCVM